MEYCFENDSFWQYADWAEQDNPDVAQTINLLFSSIRDDGTDAGLGDPRPGPNGMGYIRRIDGENELAYDVKDDVLYIWSCKGVFSAEQESAADGAA